MTVPVQFPFISHTASGSSATFAFDYLVIQKADLLVTVGGSLLTQNDFSVTGLGEDNGGTVTLVAGNPAAGTSVIIQRSIPLSREIDYQQSGEFRAVTVNADFDRIWQALQDGRLDTNGAIRYPSIENLDGTLPSAGTRAQMLLGFDPNGYQTLYPVPASVGAGDIVVDQFVGGVDFTAGVTTVLTLSRPPGNPSNLELFFDALYQGPDQWALVGTTLTFSSPIPVGVSKVFARIGTTLSTLIPAVGSVGDAQIVWSTILTRDVDNIVALRQLDKSKYKRAQTFGYYVPGDLGGGTYWLDDSDSTSPENGGTVIVGIDGGRWKLTDAAPTALQFGIKGDGTTDESTKIQGYIDAMKGKTARFPIGRQYVMAGVTLNGSAYDGTTVTFEGELLLKPAGALPITPTYQGAYVGLLVKDCDRVTINFRGHGNRANQPATEFIYLLATAGATNLKIPSFIAREVRGDGLYLNQSNWLANSTNTNGVTIGFFEVTNSADDGRNALSIISADNVEIDTFRSYGVGGTVGGTREPGGLDIEPDNSWQSCKNISIANVNVVSSGTNGLAVLGRAGAQVTQNVVIGVANVVNTAPATVNDANGATTQTDCHTLVVLNAQDVTIGEYQGSYISAYGDAVIVSNSANVSINGALRHVREGIRAGNDVDDVAGAGLINCHINLKISDISRFGFRVGKVAGCTFEGTVSNPTQAYYPGGLFGVYATSYTQSDTEYKVNCRYHAAWDRTYRRDPGTPPTFINVAIRDCDCSGAWGAPLYTNQVGDMPVPRFNVRGVTDQGTTPSVGSGLWFAGQYVKNNSPAVGAPKGWYFAAGAWVSEGNL